MHLVAETIRSLDDTRLVHYEGVSADRREIRRDHSVPGCRLEPLSRGLSRVTHPLRMLPQNPVYVAVGETAERFG